MSVNSNSEREGPESMSTVQDFPRYSEKLRGGRTQRGDHSIKRGAREKVISVNVNAIKRKISERAGPESMSPMQDYHRDSQKVEPVKQVVEKLRSKVPEKAKQKKVSSPEQKPAMHDFYTNTREQFSKEEGGPRKSKNSVRTQ